MWKILYLFDKKNKSKCHHQNALLQRVAFRKMAGSVYNLATSIGRMKPQIAVSGTACIPKACNFI